jgi:HSP20 family protein
VTLPGEVDGDGVSARLKDGVLSIRVPKSPGAKPRRIPISS